MHLFLVRLRHRLFIKTLNLFIAFSFLLSSVLPSSFAQVLPRTLLNLPTPGSKLALTAEFTPTLIKGITINPQNPLQFDFIVDTGDETIGNEALRTESLRLIKYFLASLTVPENEMWVNLSPYEKNRIIPSQLGSTEMGRDMLSQDYILKQLTASLMDPEEKLGKEFWGKMNAVIASEAKQSNTTEIATSQAPRNDRTVDVQNLFHKIWIVPEKAVVYEHENSAFVVESHLKVMLEEDLVAYQELKGKNEEGRKDQFNNASHSTLPTSSLKEILLPAIEKEVNTGKNFATLRQIANSMILATWFKRNLKESLLGKMYVDQNKVKGIDLEDKNIKQKIYDQYLEALKKGVYNQIKEEYDPQTQEIAAKHYFSGGEMMRWSPAVSQISDFAALSRQQRDALPKGNRAFVVTANNIDVGPNGKTPFAAQSEEDSAMVAESKDEIDTPNLKLDWRNDLKEKADSVTEEKIDQFIRDLLLNNDVKRYGKLTLSYILEELVNINANPIVIKGVEKELGFELFRTNAGAFFAEPTPEIQEALNQDPEIKAYREAFKTNYADKIKDIQQKIKALPDAGNLGNEKAEGLPKEKVQEIIDAKNKNHDQRQELLDKAYALRELKNKYRAIFNKAWEIIQKGYANNNPQQIVDIARQHNRPKAAEIVKSSIFKDFEELSDPKDPLHADKGERYVPMVREVQEAMYIFGFSIEEATEYVTYRRNAYYDDPSVLTGTAKFVDPKDPTNTTEVMVIGLQKGMNAKERVQRNAGKSRPWGYWKAIRAMRLAEKKGIPIVTFIDTPGADNTLASEIADQSGAISYGIQVEQELKVPMMSFIVGEAGSAGSMVASQGGELYLLQNAVRYVAVPEGSYFILDFDKKLDELIAKRKDGSKRDNLKPKLLRVMADALQADAKRSKELGVIDGIVPEAPGGYHRFPEVTYLGMSRVIESFIERNKGKSAQDIREERRKKWRKLGSIENADFVVKAEEKQRTKSIVAKEEFNKITEGVVGTLEDKLYSNDEIKKEGFFVLLEKSLMKAYKSARPWVEMRWLTGVVRKAVKSLEKYETISRSDIQSALNKAFTPEFYSIQDRLEQIVDRNEDGSLKIIQELNPNLADTTIIDYTAPFKESFPEFVDLMDVSKRVKEAQEATGSWSGLFTGYVMIKGVKTLLTIKDPRWFSASATSSVSGEKLTRALEDVLEKNKNGERIPVVIINTASGAVQQEGQRSMDPLNKELNVLSQLKENNVPVMLVGTYLIFGGDSASKSTMQNADILLLEEGTVKGFTGGRLVLAAENTFRQGKPVDQLTDLPRAYQSADMLLKQGNVDGIVKRNNLPGYIANFVSGKIDELPLTVRQLARERIQRVKDREIAPFDGLDHFKPIEPSFETANPINSPEQVAKIAFYLSKMHLMQARLRNYSDKREDIKFVDSHLRTIIAILNEVAYRIGFKGEEIIREYLGLFKLELHKTEDSLRSSTGRLIYAPRFEKIRKVLSEIELQLEYKGVVDPRVKDAGFFKGGDSAMVAKVADEMKKSGGNLTFTEAAKLIREAAGKDVSDVEVAKILNQVAYATGYFGPANDRDISSLDPKFASLLGAPGSAPFTRGIFPSAAGRKGGRPTSVRKYSSYGTAKEANAIQKKLVAEGATGLSIAFDLATQIGLDADHPLVQGSVGKVGVSVNSIRDMNELLEGVPIEKLSLSQTINSTGPILMAMHIAAAKKRGIPLDKIAGSIQHDVLKEYTARGTHVWGYEATMRLAGDVFEWASKNVPAYKPTTVSGYHARERGANAIQEDAFAIADALQYLTTAKKRNMTDADLARIMKTFTWFMNLKLKTFEEVAKFRALRRIWSTLVREAFGLDAQKIVDAETKKLYNDAAKAVIASWAGGSDVRFGNDEQTNKMHDHMIRNAIRAFNGMLLGVQSFDGAAFDESIGIPSDFAMSDVLDRFAVGIEETGLFEVTDPFGGSYFLEAETNRIEAKVWGELNKISKMGSFKDVLDYMREDIRRQGTQESKDIADKKLSIVGVNTDLEGSEFYPKVTPPEDLRKSFDAEQKARLDQLKASRDNATVEEALNALEAATRGSENLMPFILSAVEAEATLGEISDRISRVYGVSSEKPWESKPWVDAQGKMWEPKPAETDPEVFDAAIREYIQKKSAEVSSAQSIYDAAKKRGYFSPKDTGYVKGESLNARRPAEFPYTRGIGEEKKASTAIEIPSHKLTEGFGITAAQELAISFLAALKMIEAAPNEQKSQVANAIQLALSTSNNPMEDIAKFRVARRIWAKLMKDRGINDEDAQKLWTKAVTNITTLTEEKPFANVPRLTLQAYQARLGGANEIEVLPFDARFSETEYSAMARQMAKDTLAIIEKEAGIEGIQDPLGGSFLVESLTDRMEADVMAELNKMMVMSGSAQFSEGTTPLALEGESQSTALAIVGDILPVGSAQVPAWITPALAQYLVGTVEKSQREALAAFTAGLRTKVGVTTKKTGDSAIKLKTTSASDVRFLPAGKVTIETLSSQDLATREHAANVWFDRARELLRKARAAIDLNNQARPETNLIGGVSTARLYVDAKDFSAIQSAWNNQAGEENFIITTPDGARIKILKTSPGRGPAGKIDVEIAATDKGRVTDWVKKRSQNIRFLGNQPKILIAKPGLDGHDRAATTVTDLLREAGFEVVYTDIRKTPQEIIDIAKKENIDIIGISLYSNDHKTHAVEISRLMNEAGMEQELVALGGMIPEADREFLLEKAGVDFVYGTGADVLSQSIKDFESWRSWRDGGGQIKQIGDNTFDVKLFNGHSIEIQLTDDAIPAVTRQAPATTSTSTSLALVKRDLALDPSRAPKIEGLWSEDAKVRNQAMLHFATAGDLLIEAVRRNPILAKNIVLVSKDVKPIVGNASVASVGVAVTKEHFEQIKGVHGIGHESEVPADVGAREIEVHVSMPDGTERLIDVLADTDDSAKKTLTAHIKRAGESIQQVEVWTPDMNAAIADIVAASKDKSNGIELLPDPTDPERKRKQDKPRVGANGSTVFFIIVTVENSKKVLLEFVELPKNVSATSASEVADGAMTSKVDLNVPAMKATEDARSGDHQLESGILTVNEYTYIYKDTPNGPDGVSDKNVISVTRRSAARVAAKKAIWSILFQNKLINRDYDEPVITDLKLIEIVNDKNTGAPSVNLLGEFAEISKRYHVGVTITHNRVDDSATAVAFIQPKGGKLSYGVDISSVDDFLPNVVDRVTLGAQFTGDEIDAVFEESDDPDDRAYQLAIIHSIKEAVYKAIGDIRLTWQDIYIKRDAEDYIVSINPEKLANAPMISIESIESSEDTGIVEVVVIADANQSNPPAASTGVFKRPALSRANFASHVEKNLKEGMLRIVGENEPAMRKLNSLARKNVELNKALKLLEARGIEVRVIDATLESLYKAAREKAADPSALDPIIRKHEAGFLALTLGKSELDSLGITAQLKVDAQAKGVTLINGALLDDLGPDAVIKEESLALLLESELINEAGHADNPSVPAASAEAEAWISEMHEEAAGLLAQVENLIGRDSETLENARLVVIDKNQVLRLGGNATKISIVNERNGLKWIYDRYGRVILADGLLSTALDLADRFKVGGDLASEYDAANHSFSTKAIEEVLAVLQKNDEDFKTRKLPIIDAAVADVTARLEHLKKALKDPASVGQVVTAKIQLSPEEKLKTLPKPPFTESASSNLIYRGTLAVDLNNKAELQAALEGKADAIYLNLDVENILSAQANVSSVLKDKETNKNIILGFSHNSDDWADHLDLIATFGGRGSGIKAVVVDSNDLLAVRTLDNELTKIEQSKGWKKGSIGIILKSSKTDNLEQILPSTPRVIGVLAASKNDPQFALAKRLRKIVISEEDANYESKFEQEFDGVITRISNHIAAIEQAFDPSSRTYIKSKIDLADQLIQQKADAESMPASQTAEINTKIEEALWGPLMAVRLGAFDLTKKDDLALYEKILKLRQESYYEPGMKRTMDLRGATNINDYFDLFTKEHPDQVFKYVSRFEEKEPGKTEPVFVDIKVRDLDRAINQMANHLYDSGIRKGDRVSLMMPNAIQFYVAFRAALKIGAVAVNMEEGLSAKQVSENLMRSEVKAIFYDDVSRATLDQVAKEIPDTFKNFKAFVQLNLDDVLPNAPPRAGPLGEISGIDVSDFQTILKNTSDSDPAKAHGIIVNLDDIAFEQFTSGTTSKPKRVGHTHRGWMSVAASLSQFYKSPTKDTETVFAILPLIHTYGLTSAVIVPMVTGANSIILPRRNTSQYFEYAARLLLQGGIKQVFATPAIYQGVINEIRSIESNNLDEIKKKLGSIRQLTSRGSKLPSDLIDFIESAIGISPTDGFGSSETPSVTTNPASYNIRGTLGIPGPGAQIRLRGKNAEGKYDIDGPILPLGNEGLIGYKSDGTFATLGYILDPTKTAEVVDEDGYIYPGDVFYLRQDGLTEFRSRKGDMLNKGGRNIAPETIEDAAKTLPGVKNSGAISVYTDPLSGDDTIHLHIEMQDGKEGTLTEQDVLNGIRPLLAPHEIPDRIGFGKIPVVGGLTKIKRGELRKRILEGDVEDRGPVDNRVGNSKETLAIMPPAGYHFAGMGKDIFEKYDFVRDLYRRMTRVLQEIRNDTTLDLADISFGDRTSLMDEDFVVSAVALYTYEVATALVYEHRFGTPAMYAGESMGEPAAMTAAGYITPEVGLRWTYENALYLHKVSTKENLRMAVVNGLTEDQVKAALREQDGQIVIRESNKLFIVSMKVDLNEEGEARYAKFVAKAKELNPDVKFYESAIATAAHDSRMDPKSHGADGQRYQDFLKDLASKLLKPRAKVINTLTGEFLPENDPQAVIAYIEKTKYTTIEWKTTIQAAVKAGTKHFANLALRGSPFVLSQQREDGIIPKESIISPLGYLHQFDLANKGQGQTFNGKARRVSSFDTKKGFALDLRTYAFASGDRNAYHLNPAWASRTPYGGVIAHGTFTESTVLSALQDQFEGYEVYGSRVELKAPVKPGDVIRPVFIIDQIGDKGETLVVSTGALNQNGDIILSGKAKLRKAIVQGAAFDPSARNIKTIEELVKETQAEESTEPGSFEKGKSAEYSVDVTPEKLQAFQYLFSQSKNNRGFIGKDLFLAKGFLSFASFMFVKGYVHVENEVEEVLKPINVGDKITLKTKITDVEGPQVTFSVEAVNQNGETVFKGFVRKLKDELKLQEEAQYSSDRVEFEKLVRKKINRLLSQVIQQIFPSHNRRFAEKGVADTADSLTFDNEDSSRPETQGLAESVLNSIFNARKTGTSARKMSVWRYLINISPKQRKDVIAALRDPKILTPESFAKAIKQDVTSGDPEIKALFNSAKAAFSSYLTTNGYPNMEYREELIHSIETFDFLDKLVWFRPNSVRNSLNPPMFARNMVNTMGKHGNKFSGIFAPKVDAGEDLRTIDRVFTLEEIEHGGDATDWYVGGMLIQSLLETPLAFINTDDIAGSTKRLVALIFGLVDYIAATGGKDQQHQFRYQLSAKRRTIQAAKKEGIFSVDGITPALTVTESQRDALRSAWMGFSTKWSIHIAHTEGITSVRDQFRGAGDIVDGLIRRVVSHQGAAEFGDEGVFDRKELEKHAREETRILQPDQKLERNREAKFRTPVELSVQELLAKESELVKNPVEAVIVTDIGSPSTNTSEIRMLERLRAKGIKVVFAISKADLEQVLRPLLNLAGGNIDAVLLRGKYGISDVESLTNVLNNLESEGIGRNINIHLSISTNEQFEQAYKLGMVQSGENRSRVTTFMYDMPETAVPGSHYAKLLEFYKSLPKEFYYDWDKDKKQFVPPQEIKRDPKNFFLTTPDAVHSPEEAARLDQMGELLPHAYAAGVNVIYRANKGNAVDAYFDAMDANMMGYFGMVVDADHIQEQATEVMRGITPERELIEESLRVIKTYYDKGKALGEGAIQFQFKYGIRDVLDLTKPHISDSPGLVDEATNKIYIALLKRALELGLLSEEETRQYNTYAFERYYTEGPRIGEIIDLRQWEFLPNDYSKVRLIDDHNVVLNVSDTRPSVDKIEEAAIKESIKLLSSSNENDRIRAANVIYGDHGAQSMALGVANILDGNDTLAKLIKMPYRVGLTVPREAFTAIQEANNAVRTEMPASVENQSLVFDLDIDNVGIDVVTYGPVEGEIKKFMESADKRSGAQKYVHHIKYYATDLNKALALLKEQKESGDTRIVKIANEIPVEGAHLEKVAFVLFEIGAGRKVLIELCQETQRSAAKLGSTLRAPDPVWMEDLVDPYRDAAMTATVSVEETLRRMQVPSLIASQDLVNTWMVANDSGMSPFIKDNIVPGLIVISPAISAIAKAFPTYKRISQTHRLRKSVIQGETILYGKPEIISKEGETLTIRTVMSVDRGSENNEVGEVIVNLRPKTTEELRIGRNLDRLVDILPDDMSGVLRETASMVRPLSDQVKMDLNVGQSITVEQAIDSDYIKREVAIHGKSPWASDLMAVDIFGQAVTKLLPAGFVGGRVEIGALKAKDLVAKDLKATIKVVNRNETSSNKLKYTLLVSISMPNDKDRLGEEILSGTIDMYSQKEINDAAMTSSITETSADNALTVTDDTFTKGGIDLNPALFDMQIKRDGKGIPLPYSQQPTQNIRLEGLFPVIINIKPIGVKSLSALTGQDVVPEADKLIELSKSR